MEILDLLNQQLVKLLTTALPKLNSDWWNSLVLNKLTYQQKTFASSLPAQALERLDLAALLRVADQNWYDIASQGDFNRETRNWLKEAQSIRNRWAHAPAEGLPDDVRYRDIDTIERLLLAFGADSLTLGSIKQEKQKTLLRLAALEQQPLKPSTDSVADSTYKPGDMVRLKADPSKTGAVTNSLSGEAENRYQVFHDGNISTYYESQLETLATTVTRTTITPDALHTAMITSQLRLPTSTSLFAGHSFLSYCPIWGSTLTYTTFE